MELYCKPYVNTCLYTHVCKLHKMTFFFCIIINIPVPVGEHFDEEFSLNVTITV